MDMFQQFIQHQAEINRALIQQLQTPSKPQPAAAFSTPPPQFYGKVGENVRSWLFQVNTLFCSKGTPENARIYQVAGCLKDAAFQWYHNRCTTLGQFQDWRNFEEEIVRAFEPVNNQHLLDVNLNPYDRSEAYRNMYTNSETLLDRLQTWENSTKFPTSLTV